MGKMGASTNNLVSEDGKSDYGEARKLPQYVAALSGIIMKYFSNYKYLFLISI